MDDERAAILARLARVVSTVGPDQPLATRLCWASVDIMDVDGAAITVSNVEPEHTTLATTDPIAQRLEDLQELLGEGPGPDAYRSGTIIIATIDEVVRRRWPVFVPAAKAAVGPLQVVAVPMRPAEEPLGVLSLYQHRPRPLAHGPEAVQFLANSIGVALLRDLVGDQLHADTWKAETWSGRARVHQATGMVIAQLGVSAGDALALLRAHAYASETTLDRIATRILDRRLDFSTIDDSSSGDTHA